MQAPGLRSALAAVKAHPNPAVVLFSSAMLLTAFGFQYIGGMAPCALCWDQRWAHMAAIFIAIAASFLKGRLAGLGTAAAGTALLVGAGIAGYHVGVENHWWATSCAISVGGASSLDELRAQLEATPFVRCDDIAWSLFDISMAGWNGLLSLAAGLAAAAAGLRSAIRPR